MSPLDLADLEAAAERERAEVESEDPRGSVISLCSALSELTACLFSAVSGEPDEAAGFHLEASFASADAFPLGTSESAAFGVLLDYAAGVMRRAAS